MCLSADDIHDDRHAMNHDDCCRFFLAALPTDAALCSHPPFTQAQAMQGRL